jgi:hypothetical protein
VFVGVIGMLGYMLKIPVVKDNCVVDVLFTVSGVVPMIELVANVVDTGLGAAGFVLYVNVPVMSPLLGAWKNMVPIVYRS